MTKLEIKINEEILKIINEDNTILLENILKMDFSGIANTERSEIDPVIYVDLFNLSKEVLQCSDLHRLLGVLILFEEEGMYKNYNSNKAIIVEVLEYALEVYDGSKTAIRIDYPHLPSFREINGETELYNDILSDIRQEIGRAMFERRNPEFTQYSSSLGVEKFLEDIDFEKYIEEIIEADFDISVLFVEDYTLYFFQYEYR